jgi:hypothetical protein
LIETGIISRLCELYATFPNFHLLFLQTFVAILTNYPPSTEIFSETKLFQFLGESLKPPLPPRDVLLQILTAFDLFCLHLPRDRMSLAFSPMANLCQFCAIFHDFRHEEDRFCFQRLALSTFLSFAREMETINFVIANQLHESVLHWILESDSSVLSPALTLILTLLSTPVPEFQTQILDKITIDLFNRIFSDTTEIARITGCQILQRIVAIDQVWIASPRNLRVILDVRRIILADPPFPVKSEALFLIAVFMLKIPESLVTELFIDPPLVEQIVAMAEIMEHTDKSEVFKDVLLRISRFPRPIEAIQRLLLPLFVDGLLADADCPIDFLVAHPDSDINSQSRE